MAAFMPLVFLSLVTSVTLSNAVVGGVFQGEERKNHFSRLGPKRWWCGNKKQAGRPSSDDRPNPSQRTSTCLSYLTGMKRQDGGISFGCKMTTQYVVIT